MALFEAVDSSSIRLIAAASTTSELLTCARAFQPDAAIVADDLGSAPDLATQLETLQETLHNGRVFVVGPSAAAVAVMAGATSLGNCLDGLNGLGVPVATADPLAANSTQR
jgi:hypothetical protein